MSEVWTHGTWTVTAGRESDFVRLWEQLGDWTVKAFPGPGDLAAGHRALERLHQLRALAGQGDRRRWRASAEFQEHLAAIRETLELFEPRLLEPVATKH